MVKINKILPVCLVTISLFLSSGFGLAMNSEDAKFSIIEETQFMEKILEVVGKFVNNFMGVTVDHVKPSLELFSAQIHFEHKYTKYAGVHPTQDQDISTDFVREIFPENDQIFLPLSDFVPRPEPSADEFVLYIGEILFLPSGFIFPRDGGNPPQTDCIKTEILSIQDSDFAFNKSALIRHSFESSLPDGPYNVKVKDKDGNLLYENTFNTSVFQYGITGLNSTAVVTNPLGKILAVGFLDVGTDAVGDWAYIKTEIGNVSCEGPFLLEAEINIDPDTLNLKSRGKWITAYIEFPIKIEKGYLVNITVEYQGLCYDHPGDFVLKKGETITSSCDGYDYKITLTAVGATTTTAGTKYTASFEVTDGVETKTVAIEEGKTDHLFFLQDNMSITVVDISEFEIETGEDVMTIDVNTVTLNYNNQSIPAENNPKYGFVKDPQPYDTDGDGIPEFMVKFDRSAMQEMLADVLGDVTLIVKGEFGGGEFEGSDTIRIIG